MENRENEGRRESGIEIKVTLTCRKERDLGSRPPRGRSSLHLTAAGDLSYVEIRLANSFQGVKMKILSLLFNQTQLLLITETTKQRHDSVGYTELLRCKASYFFPCHAQ